jgi:hypothetical protein
MAKRNRSQIQKIDEMYKNTNKMLWYYLRKPSKKGNKKLLMPKKSQRTSKENALEPMAIL